MKKLRLDYAWSTNLRTTGTVDGTIGGLLVGAGFSQGFYYYKYLSQSGSFNLYNN